MKLGFVGLGRMGMPMVARLQQAGHATVVYDPDIEAVAKTAKHQATPAHSLSELVEKLDHPAVLWLMIPAAAVDEALDTILPLLKAGSTIIDGGNSDYRQTLERSKRASGHGVSLVDVGTSGGVLAGSKGYCMMVGGDAEAVASLEPLFAALAQPQGWLHVGPSGSGHYVKMVHNAIEYGMMESLAEGYHVLKEGAFTTLDLGSIAKLWQHGSIVESLLNELTAQALTESPQLEGIDGFVAESGETRWTLETAKEHRIDAPAIQAAMDVRLASQKGRTSFATKLLAAMRHKFGGHALNK